MAHIFDLEDPKFKLLRSCKGHEATIQLAFFSHDSSHLITGDNDGFILVWNNLDCWDPKFGIGDKHCFVVDNAHDLGVTCGDCQPDKGIFFVFFNFLGIYRISVFSFELLKP